jgi:hypothetical protein
MQRAVVTQRALHGSRVSAAVRGCAGSIARVGGSATGMQAALEGRVVVAMEAPHRTVFWRPSFETTPSAGPQDEDLSCGEIANPLHGEGAW